MDPGKIALEQMMLSKRRIAHTNNNTVIPSTVTAAAAAAALTRATPIVSRCRALCFLMPRPGGQSDWLSTLSYTAPSYYQLQCGRRLPSSLALPVTPGMGPRQQGAGTAHGPRLSLAHKTHVHMSQPLPAPAGLLMVLMPRKAKRTAAREPSSASEKGIQQYGV
ncbi:hypothetical protein M441DRAFT_242799 [Trichoderma asperellum CBS 433.97]|uniref:Uncharacterized protein n=1 Tax=Trichoderma asperellum (strain ATCC 204424 / CBS 433.97 / NBRC 101777) TaxID=1042311 RepID=A0A2T3Z2H2_TRIA4|nr:hypothetical protein M441DRAFT_242799 [Trichoderma asperellum CBS 433.97]PTB39002.1 hypothetical protein M441DRAFT_242799 [Trichoderma asperellum CBS 433.97]